MNSTQRSLAIAAVIGVGLVAGFLSYRLQSARPALRAVDSSAAPGSAAAAAEDTDAPPAPPAARPVPTTVPELELPDLAGHPRALRSFLHGPLILNFWATWCEPCRREIPLLQELRHAHRGERLEIVGIAIDSLEAVQEFVRRRPIDYPLLVGERQGLEAAQQFGMEPVLPFSVFADAQGHIIAVKVGELHQEEADFILGAMRQVASGKKSLSDARAGIADQLRTFAVQRAKAGTNDS